MLDFRGHRHGVFAFAVVLTVTELISVVIREGASLPIVQDFLSRLGLDVVPFDFRQAVSTGSLSAAIRHGIRLSTPNGLLFVERSRRGSIRTTSIRRAGNAVGCPT
jgi:hypothetical protein